MTITGYFIDPENGIAEPRTIEKSLSGYYSLLRCSTIDIVDRALGGRRFEIVCDDEGLFREGTFVSAIFRDGTPALVGPIFVTKFDGREDITSLTDEELDYVDSRVFTGWAATATGVRVASVLEGLDW